MRPVVVSAIFLLVVLMYMPDTGKAQTSDVCKTKYPEVKCGQDGWYRLTKGWCMKINNKLMSLSKAKTACKKMGARLYSPTSIEHLNKVLCQMSRTSVAVMPFWSRRLVQRRRVCGCRRCYYRKYRRRGKVVKRRVCLRKCRRRCSYRKQYICYVRNSGAWEREGCSALVASLCVKKM